MNDSKSKVSILIADDDPDDRMLLEDAFRENGFTNELHFVEDGEQLLAFLRREGKWAEHAGEPYPGLVLLDLNMPKMDGREALKHMKADERFQTIPVVVLTTSKAEEDILRTYVTGVNSFMTKPVTFEGLMEVVRILANYWIQSVQLPPQCTQRP